MLSTTRFAAFCLFVVFAAQPAWAENIYVCPDISKAVKVGSCPSEEELQRMYHSTCGSRDLENENPHAKGLCRKYSVFKKAKNTALWESSDGEYVGYLSCDSTEDQIKAGKLTKLSIGQKRVWDRVICTYDSGSNLVLRTRETCSVPGAKPMGSLMSRICGASDADCKAICQ